MNFTDTQIQAAIDAAFPAGDRIDGWRNLDTCINDKDWPKEAPRRLSVAKAFLKKLEVDPYTELKKAHAEGKVIEYTDDNTYNGVWQKCINPLWVVDCDQWVNPRYRVKPKPETFKTQPNQAPQTNQDVWTPAVGDVVRLKSVDLEYPLTRPEGRWEKGELTVFHFGQFPDYFNDLNAVHELEGAGLNGGQYDAFVFHLLEIARRDGAPACESDLVCCARATATQRAEAIGLTLGLWK